MAFDMLHLTSGRLQNSDFTTLHSLYGSSVSGAEAMPSFSIVTQDTSPDTSRISAHSNNSSTKKLKRRHAKRGRFSKRKTATSLLEDASACDPLSLNALASLSSKWLNLSFLDRSPTYTDYFVNYWRHALAKEQDIFVDHFTTVMAAVHEDLQAPSTILSTQSSPVQCDESSKYIPYEITCPWGNEEKCRLNGIKWDEWRWEDDEIYIPTGKHHDYGAIGEPPIYPLRNMGTHFQIVAPKPIRAWNNISWLGHPPVAAAVYETSQTPLMKSIYPSTFTTHHPHAESTDIDDSTSASPSSYLSALAAAFPPAGRHIPPVHVDDSHLTIYETKPICVERQQSRDHKLFQFLRMSYDQKSLSLKD
ncbi:uncharacterized protein EDB93DRAFT_1105652 [Suillus bovinus]|uniref:uncharacterized protein n=1 Tax=Suillus bovinus TaxID=48563 RepID=UPI001B869578|nr:uncharacterized protein EDB93DRAFT_1105652 [Suillus bovinus]KAG2141808.1 hypothetical protein EDB93DRAFT_1105652 [Suillus bovinus]